jgi:anthranilate synthase/aminodeoxychorismate synthase-like glutamine amidotransferase
MLLLLDNFDSFVYNLARYFEELGQETLVVRNDAIDVAGVRALRPQAIILSPGPCDPSRAGVSLDVVRELGAKVPILGVCLGHQVIGAAYGAEVIRGEPVHGRAAEVHHDGRGIFRDIPSPFTAARYHSLILSPGTIPETLEVTARLDDGTCMAVRHRKHPVVGVQFHPESVLTEHGPQFLRNFLLLEKERETVSEKAPLVVSTAYGS